MLTLAVSIMTSAIRLIVIDSPIRQPADSTMSAGG
jgi:hypothetical protein